MTARQLDTNGWPEIKDNPISKVGVFPYRGSMIDPNGEMGLDPEEVYSVYRSAEELSNQETIDSFKLLPWVDEHLMLGEHFAPAEEKGIQGVIGENVYFEDGYLYGNLKLFSGEHAKKVEDGKAELSCGFRCKYELQEGVFGDQKYGVVQTEIRGNHLASVDEGRMGPDVSVLDQKLTFAVDTKDFETMPDDDKKKTLDEYAKDGVEAEEVSEALQMIASELVEMRDSKDEKPTEDMEDKDRDLAQDEDKDDEKPTEDMEEDDDKKPTEDMEEDDDKKSGAMDAMDKKVRTLRRDLDRQGKTGVKSVMKEIRIRDALYEKVSPHIGAFDHQDMTSAELALYACKKLELKVPEGHEVTAIDSYLSNRPALTGFGTDSILRMPSEKKPGVVDKLFEGEAAR